MKKFLVIILMMFGFTISSYADEEIYFDITGQSEANLVNNQWRWSPWESCSGTIKFLFTSKVATLSIYDTYPKTYYMIPSTMTYFTDPKGARAFSVKAKDHAGRIVLIKFHPSPTNQVYVCYPSSSYVWSIRKN